MPDSKRFLDTAGLTLYDQNIKNYINNIVEEDISPEIDAKADDSVFGASGSTHSKGLVPDPGATAGSTKFLREDGTWAVPAGGGGGGSGDVNVIESISVNNVAQTVDANRNVDITVPVTDVQTSTDGSTYATVVDANKVAKIDLSGYAETSDIPEPAQAMASGDTGYVTGDMLYTVMSDIETFLANY